VSRLVSFPNLKVMRCGTDFADSYRTLGEAAAYVPRAQASVRARQGDPPMLAFAVG
jgi:hypothetical protein